MANYFKNYITSIIRIEKEYIIVTLHKSTYSKNIQLSIIFKIQQTEFFSNATFIKIYIDKCVEKQHSTKQQNKTRIILKQKKMSRPH